VEREVLMDERTYDVALWVTPDIDQRGRTVMPAITVEVKAASPFLAVLAVMWASRLRIVHRAACSDRRGLEVRWYRLRNHPACMCQGISVKRFEQGYVTLSYLEGR
jgi:hypothetical protein